MSPSTARPAVVQAESGFVYHEVAQRVVRQAERAAVEPHEIGRVGRKGLYLRNVFFAVVRDEIEIRGEVGEQLVEPVLALVEGGLHCGEGKGVVAVDVHSLPPLIEHLFGVRVGKYHGAGLKSGKVEGFCAGYGGGDIGGYLW